MNKKATDEAQQADLTDTKDLNTEDSTLHNPEGLELFSANQMDILQDVEMQLTVEIGRTKMKIADLLSLKRGEVIELQQATEEPLHIYVSDKLVGKGQIVSTQGKYFIKIM